jgi:hypothetical protein
MGLVRDFTLSLRGEGALIGWGAICGLPTKLHSVELFWARTCRAELLEPALFARPGLALERRVQDLLHGLKEIQDYDKVERALHESAPSVFELKCS